MSTEKPNTDYLWEGSCPRGPEWSCDDCRYYDPQFAECQYVSPDEEDADYD